jgi:hypothetical protein
MKPSSKPSFSIDFYFTDVKTVYDNDKSLARYDREKFVSNLLYTIWEINQQLSDESFPLEKIEIKQHERHCYVPCVEMSMPKKLMDSFVKPVNE